MKGRQPSHERDVILIFPVIGHIVQIVEQVPVRDHDALGIGGGTGGVLQEGDGPGVDFRCDPFLRQSFRHGIRGKPIEFAEIGIEAGKSLADFVQTGHGQRQRGPRVARHYFQSRQTAVQPARIGRVHRHRDHARVQAAEERRGIVESRRVEHEYAVARLAPLAQRHGNRPRAPVELTKGVAFAFFFAILEIGIGEMVGTLERTVL